MTNRRWHQADGGRCPPDVEDAAYLAEPGRVLKAEREGAAGPGAGPTPPPSEGQLDRWLAAMERLRLAEYVRYVDDRKRLFWSNFLGGMARGVGMAVGFTILGAVLVLILQDLAKHNLPVIGDFLAQIVSVVQKRLE